MAADGGAHRRRRQSRARCKRRRLRCIRRWPSGCDGGGLVSYRSPDFRTVLGNVTPARGALTIGASKRASFRAIHFEGPLPSFSSRSTHESRQRGRAFAARGRSALLLAPPCAPCAPPGAWRCRRRRTTAVRVSPRRDQTAKVEHLSTGQSH